MADPSPPTPDGGSPFRRIAVIGCGLVGGSFALASRVVPGVDRVTVYDRDAAVRERARELGVADHVADDLAAAVAGADLVVLALPVPVIAAVAADLAGLLPEGAVVTDVGSVKSGVVRAVESALAGGRFIGGHPMAGSERSGVEAADATLFQGATWVLTPTVGADHAAFTALSAHLRGIGARVLAVDPDRHDRVVAVASHLPQVLASVLMVHAADVAQAEGESVLAVTAGGFRDVTRVAASDPVLWLGILAENRDAVLEAIDGFAGRLASLRTAVADGDRDQLSALLAAARKARLALPVGKPVAGVLVDLVVAMPDHPGALAEVTTALGDGGINIEDLSMRHATDGRRGALIVAVDGHDAADRARRLLAGRGYPSHVEAR